MEDRERQRELKDSRYRDWQTRRRDPGDLITWAVVLGGALAVLLFFCAAYDGNPMLGAAIAVILIAWVLVTSIMGGVNVLAVLWGRAASDEITPEQERIVFGASAVLALIAIALPVVDLVSPLDFGVYGLIAGAVGLIYVLVVWRGLRRRA